MNTLVIIFYQLYLYISVVSLRFHIPDVCWLLGTNISYFVLLAFMLSQDLGNFNNYYQQIK